jgi:predicted alpha/beta-fold hydrolase
MWTVTKPRGPPVHYRRRIFDADHATYKGTFAVDFVVPPPPPPTQSERSEPGNAADIAAAGPDGLGLGVPGEEMSARGQERESGALPRRTAWFPDDEWARFASDDTRPQLVVLHGLSGGSHEVYLRQTIEPLIRTGKWEILVVNSRGCAWSRITSGVLYNARATWDVRQVGEVYLANSVDLSD